MTSVLENNLVAPKVNGIIPVAIIRRAERDKGPQSAAKAAEKAHIQLGKYHFLGNRSARRPEHADYGSRDVESAAARPERATHDDSCRASRHAFCRADSCADAVMQHQKIEPLCKRLDF